MKILVFLNILLCAISIDGHDDEKFFNTKNVLKGNSFTLSYETYNKTSIKYCWFLSPNNTFFPIHHDTSNPHYEYFGEGFSKGHCGIKIKNSNFADSGKWKGKIGNETAYDLEFVKTVNVYETLLVAQKKQIYLSNSLQFNCETFDRIELEYCRFIGPDGRGIFPIKGNGSRYSNKGTDQTKGLCTLNIKNVYGNDAGNWTCLAKPIYENVEYFDTFIVYHQYPNDLSFWNILVWTMYVALISAIVIISSLILFRLRIDSSTSRQARPVISNTTI